MGLRDDISLSSSRSAKSEDDATLPRQLFCPACRSPCAIVFYGASTESVKHQLGLHPHAFGQASSRRCQPALPSERFRWWTGWIGIQSLGAELKR